jgi:HEAT repeat protein
MKMLLFLPVALGCVAALAAQPARFEDVIRNLRNPDQKARLSAVRLLREARYPEAIVPLAPLVTDPVDQIQLEAIAAELAFFLVDPVPDRRWVGPVEVRNRGGAPAAFDLGALAVWPRRAPLEVIDALLKAVDDENPRVRLEAIYAVGVIGVRGIPPASEQGIVKALDHYDPAIRAGAARVAGRVKAKTAADALFKAITDSSAEVRYPAIRALGELREERATQAITEQLKFYTKGEGAWSAVDALARIAHLSSVPTFQSRFADRDPYIRRAAIEGAGRAGDTSSIPTIESAVVTDGSATVRAAAAFALHKLGRPFLPRLVASLADTKLTLQVQGYLLELGAPIENSLVPELQNPDPNVRAGVAEALGEIGGDDALAALKALQDRDKRVAEAAARAVERITIKRGT